MTPPKQNRIGILLKWVLFLGVLAGPAMVWLSGTEGDGDSRIGLSVIGFYVLVAACVFGPWIKRRWW